MIQQVQCSMVCQGQNDRRDPSYVKIAANSVRIKAGCAAEQPALFYAGIVLNLAQRRCHENND